MEKFIKIVISEIVEGIIFVMLIYTASILPDDAIRQQIVNTILLLWVIAGVGTPIAILLELEDQIADVFKHLSRR
jgi:hypothetical protein